MTFLTGCDDYGSQCVMCSVSACTGCSQGYYVNGAGICEGSVNRPCSNDNCNDDDDDDSDEDEICHPKFVY